ncbi:hypothetical protein, partial [Neisseria sicca]|uniref:hypothetical protein n=1 Tax=Neisseria sicca TaxID=490 RepID=UPI001649F6F6
IKVNWRMREMMGGMGGGMVKNRGKGRKMGKRRGMVEIVSWKGFERRWGEWGRWCEKELLDDEERVGKFERGRVLEENLFNGGG